MPLKLQQFTPLSQEKINNITNFLGSKAPIIAAATKRAIDENLNHKVLINSYKVASDKKNFLNNNLNEISHFLNDCNLIGVKGEKGELSDSNFVIGAEGLEVVLAYQKNKEKNVQTIPVQIIKNKNFYSKETKSKKHINIFLENNQIHDGLKEQLDEDLRIAGNNKFEKTYILESFGTTGGNHILSVTIRKNENEIDPLIHIFDSSLAITRNGLEASKLSIAIGWNSQLKINATIKKSFAENNLIFNQDKFYNNSEPLQKSGSVLCGTFAIESAMKIATMTREEHQSQLENLYKYPSPFGGKTEIETNLEALRNNNGFLANPILALPANQITMSNYTNTALKTRIFELESIDYPNKNPDQKGTTLADKVARYQTEEGFNSLASQKALRQKIGHLFEIVTNDEFLKEGKKFQGNINEIDFRGGINDASTYTPSDTEIEVPASQAKELVDAINNKVFGLIKVNHSQFDLESQTCNIAIFAGSKIACEKIINKMKGNGDEIEHRATTIDFSQNVDFVNPEFSKIEKLEITLPKERFGEIIENLQQKQALQQTSQNPFAIPTKTTPITSERLARFNEESKSK